MPDDGWSHIDPVGYRLAASWPCLRNEVHDLGEGIGIASLATDAQAIQLWQI